MDSYSIATASGSLASVAMRVSTKLYSLIDDPRYLENDVRVFRGEMDSLFQVLDSISTILKNPLGAAAAEEAQARQGGQLWNFIGTSLSGCRTVVEKLDGKMGSNEPPQKMSLQKRMMMVRHTLISTPKLQPLDLKARDVLGARQRIHFYWTSLQTGLTMIQLTLSLSENTSTQETFRKIEEMKNQTTRIERAESWLYAMPPGERADIPNGDEVFMSVSQCRQAAGAFLVTVNATSGRRTWKEQSPINQYQTLTSPQNVMSNAAPASWNTSSTHNVMTPAVSSSRVSSLQAGIWSEKAPTSQVHSPIPSQSQNSSLLPSPLPSPPLSNAKPASEHVLPNAPEKIDSNSPRGPSPVNFSRPSTVETAFPQGIPEHEVPVERMSYRAIPGNEMAHHAMPDQAMAKRASPERKLTEQALAHHAPPEQSLTEKALKGKQSTERALTERSGTEHAPTETGPSRVGSRASSISHGGLIPDDVASVRADTIYSTGDLSYRNLGRSNRFSPDRMYSPGTYGSQDVSDLEVDLTKTLLEKGELRFSRGDFRGAESYFEKVYVRAIKQAPLVSRAQLDIQHIRTRIGLCCFEQEKLKKAEDFIGQTCGPSSMLDQKLLERGTRLYESGKYFESEFFFTKVMERAEDAQNPPWTRMIQVKVGLARYKQTNYVEAIEMLALAAETESHGGDLLAFQARHHLAEVYFAEQDFDQAENEGLIALNGMRKLLGTEHALYCDSVKLLSKINRTRGDIEEAEAYEALLPASQEDVARAKEFILKCNDITSLCQSGQVKKAAPLGAGLINERLQQSRQGGLPASLKPDIEKNIRKGQGVGLASGGQGYTALHAFAEHGLLYESKILLERGADINVLTQKSATIPERPSTLSGFSTTNLDKSPLHLAAFNGHADVIRLFLQQKNLDVNAKTGSGFTALSYAAQFGHERSCQLLLGHRGIDSNTADTEGMTPLHKAAYSGKIAVLRILLAHQGLDLNLHDTEGMTALHRAASWGRSEIVEVLLTRHDIDVNSPKKDGSTPLVLAARRHRDSAEQVVKLLLERPNINVNARGEFNQTALHMASNYGNLLIVQHLLRHPEIQVNLQERIGSTALHLATFKGYTAIVQALLGHPGIDINCQDHGGSTPLHSAAQHNHQDIVDMLRGKGADLSKKDARDRAPLQLLKKQNTATASSRSSIHKGRSMFRPSFANYSSSTLQTQISELQ